MNRAQDLSILQKNPKAAGDVAAAIRKGIVKGFFAVKNPCRALTEEGIRRIYKIPDYMPAVWALNGDVVFSFCSETIRVTQDGGINRGE